jgi:hypothetical protein
MIDAQSLPQTTQNLPHLLKDLPQIITAIGGLGTAAFGLVDSTKTIPGGGVNYIGFGKIKSVVKTLTPGTPATGLSQSNILDTLKANWFNGNDLTSQKSIAKTLIKQGLTAANAPALAAATGLNATVLTSVATKIFADPSLPQNKMTQNETDVYSRFDFVLTALLDEVYQDADQRYTNWTRIIAAAFAVGLALCGGWSLSVAASYWGSSQMFEALLVGLLATPLAPIAKDLSSALAAAVNTMQLVKKP